MLLQYYLEQLKEEEILLFLRKYLASPSLKRLQKIGYFCGMDYASKEIYNFKEKITRYDHSLTTALLTNRLTKDKTSTIAGLIHDIATPCFAHVIDYMNGDYERQESTEEYTEEIIAKDTYFRTCLKEDQIPLSQVIDFKKYPIVDNERPKLCADRLDGVILTGIGWTKDITKEDIRKILQDLTLFQNEENELEMGFQTREIAERVLEVSEKIDRYCHTKEDDYMMNLLAFLTKYAIEKEYIHYKDLYEYTEEDLLKLLKGIKDNYLQEMIYEFEHKKIEDIEDQTLPKAKVRKLNPLVNGKRIR